MDLKEKIELIQSSSSKEILNGGVHNGTPLLKYVFQVHEEVFGMPCKSCADALPGYIKKIQSINLNNSIMGKKERKYRMKGGSVIRIKGTNDYYSDANISDEIAEKLLKVNPNRAQLFAKMPKGALERLAKEKEEEEAQAKIDADNKAKAEAEKAKKEKEEAAKAQAEKAKMEVVNNSPDAENQKSEKSDVVNESEEVKADKEETQKKKSVSEEVKTEETQKETSETEKADEDLNLAELREKYPEIKARSKEGFLEDLAKAQK